jgi:TetR/AcrR family transcriptional regulator, cholesterol catabolism regulator
VKRSVRKHTNRKRVMIGAKETPQKILDVAIDLFAAKGFKGTSIRDIAKACDMTISGIYYYFGNKEGLLFAILEHATHHIVEELRRAANSDLDPIARFKLLVKTHLSLLLDVYRKESKILFLDEEDLSKLSKQFQIEILKIYRRELKNLQSLGYVKYSNISTLTFNILGVINWHQRWYKPEGSMSVEQINDEMVNFVLHGALGTSLSGSQPTGH